jgi:hypothetical protein
LRWHRVLLLVGCSSFFSSFASLASPCNRSPNLGTTGFAGANDGRDKSYRNTETMRGDWLGEIRHELATAIVVRSAAWRGGILTAMVFDAMIAT